MDSNWFRLTYMKCKCKDCYGYGKYIREDPEEDQSFIQCRNDLFHQTSVLKKTVCNPSIVDCNHTALDLLDIDDSYTSSQTSVAGETVCKPHDADSKSSMSDFPSNFYYSLKSLKPAQRSVSTGHIPINSARDWILGKSKSNSEFPANFSKCSCPAPGPIVYVTFVSGSKRHEDEVASLCDMCDKAGFAVKCDNYRALQEKGELNIHQWRDENFRRAVFVLFCISPGYTATVNSIGEDNLASAGENDHEKGAIYIYNLARSELVECCSIDKRFLFVLFTNSGKGLSVPQCFSPYAKYKFPDESDTLMKAMQNRYQGSR